MNNLKIGYKVFGQNSLNYGLAYCLYRNNITAEAVTEKTAKCYDIILFSIFWWQHIYDFFKFCDEAGIGKNKSDKPYIIVGGFNSFNPVIFKNHAHAVVVGDGESVLLKAIKKEYHPSIYTGNEKEVLYNQDDISNNSFVYVNESRIARIEIARGCPYRCKFCQLSALKKYREVSLEAIEKALSGVKEKRVALFAPNKTSHKDFSKIVELLKNTRKIDLVPDVRFNDVEKFYGNGMIQIGIEGISERLRFGVGKLLSNERLKEILKFIVSKAKNEGKKGSISFGYIVDLPGETEDDWLEFNDVLDSFEEIAEKIQHFTINFIFNVFMPCPFTALEDEVIHYERDYNSKIKKVLSKQRKYSVLVRGRLFSNYHRILSMIATRGGEEVSEIANEIDKCIRKDLPDNKKILPLKFILKKYGGIERYVGVPKEKPWQIVKVIK